MSSFQAKLYDRAEECIEALLASLQSGLYLEYKLYLVQKFLPFFKFKHADHFLVIIEAKIEEEPKVSFVSFNINPLKIAIILFDILQKINSDFKITLMRCTNLKE